MSSKRQPNIFHFKKFSVRHDQVALKVGTDAVLLGAWADVDNAFRILDVGTGSGIIALMLAQRTSENVSIDAVEIEEQDALQAKENILESPWPKKIVVYHKAIQEFTSLHKYDLIVCNPPYFENSLLPPSTSRAQARHTQRLSADELIEHSTRLLNHTGKLSVILPTAEGNLFKAKALSRLHLVRETAFFSRKEKPQERWLLEFSPTSRAITSNPLVLYSLNDKKTEAYISLTKDFYL
ncbi:MAG TPA: methyltransferase [Cyclobacteriaceae bacterium]|jgi:tRNA1Val (adenine37-N6)-methyltransferase|nr:methyltransferase [Cyclobacteriaceae bacterium]